MSELNCCPCCSYENISLSEEGGKQVHYCPNCDMKIGHNSKGDHVCYYCRKHIVERNIMGINEKKELLAAIRTLLGDYIAKTEIPDVLIAEKFIELIEQVVCDIKKDIDKK